MTHLVPCHELGSRLSRSFTKLKYRAVYPGLPQNHATSTSILLNFPFVFAVLRFHFNATVIMAGGFLQYHEPTSKLFPLK